MTLFAGILNPPSFHPWFPNSVNYGGIGYVLGHELTHGFDNQGVNYDPMGNLDNWMDSESQGGFNNMSNCVTQQYDEFCFNDTNPKNGEKNCVDGTKTLGENIADNGGIRAAWLAYKKLPDQPPLPGLMGRFTHDQLFFLSSARVYCTKLTKDWREKDLLNDVHSPNKFRVNGMMRNSAEFAKSFDCKAGSKMAPTSDERCDVW